VRRTIALGIGLLVTLLAVACGNGGSKSATPTPAANPCGGASTAGCGDATTPDVRAATLTSATFAGVPQDGLTLGEADAPLTIDLYQNFLCPHCRDFAEATMPQLIADYIATGRARIVFHDAALGPDEARLAHEAAHCAADQGKFWPAYAALYANFSDDPGAYTKASIESWLAKTGVDAQQLASCLDSGEHAAEVQAGTDAFTSLGERDATYASELATVQAGGGPAIPALKVGGRYLTAPETYAPVQAAVESELGR
jgi:hypothetical protein